MSKAAAEKSTDPATWDAKTTAAKIQVQQLAAEMGAAIPGSKIGKIVDQVLKTGMDESGLRNVLGEYIAFQKNGSTLNGAAGQYEHNIREFAYHQGVSLDKQTIKNQAQLIGRGMATEQDFKSQIVNQAASMYPSYTAQLQAGQTLMDIASPYMQTMAEDLDLPVASIRLTDPLIKRALNGVDSKGKPVGMDQVTFQNQLRNDPRWGQHQACAGQCHDSRAEGAQGLRPHGSRRGVAPCQRSSSSTPLSRSRNPEVTTGLSASGCEEIEPTGSIR